MPATRRALLATVPALTLAACSGTTTPTTTTLAADLQLLDNGLAALLPLIPPQDAAQVAQVQAALAAVEAALATASPTQTTLQTITTILGDLGPAIIGLFPGGGTAVTIVQAIIALLPSLGGVLGLAATRVASTGGMTVGMARGVLGALPVHAH